ncbi:MAG TPA: glycoside hydrolase family 5 protein [Anaerolineales bacterium]|nr:glycoside hydrolase family 5 protein [Anaerolineales bacterium]
MKRVVLVPFLIILITALACSQSYVQAPTQTTASLPQLTETSLPPTFTPQLSPTPIPIPTVGLQRGVNMGNMLEAPNEGDWGLTVQEEYFDLIKDAGFDFVRLPVNWKAHTTRSGYDDFDVGYTIDPAFFARVDEIVGWVLKRNLVIIIDLHNYESLMSEPNSEQFWFLWRQIAEHYKDYPQQVVFELLNEPHDKINAAMWNVYVEYALQEIRETNPTRDVVIGPVEWNAYNWVNTLDVAGDSHVIVTFHYYEPFQFTHQGAEWVDGSDAWLGKIWPDNEERKREIIRDFDLVADWSQRHNVRILLGEFGAYSKAPQDSRVRWTEFVRGEAEAHGFAWAYWEFGAGFGVYDPIVKVWRADLLKALIP